MACDLVHEAARVRLMVAARRSVVGMGAGCVQRFLPIRMPFRRVRLKGTGNTAADAQGGETWYAGHSAPRAHAVTMGSDHQFDATDAPVTQ